MNFGGLSTWHQLQTRPYFLKAFKAINEMKSLFIKSDPYYRYFTHNIFNLAFDDLSMLENNVLGGLSAESQTAIFGDAKYGFNSTRTLYQWVKAFKGGPDCSSYKAIMAHFSSLTDFTPEVMEQIVGPQSLMVQLNNTFSFKTGYELYKTYGVSNGKLAFED